MINGISAGWWCSDSEKLPFSKAIKARCMPQPGHSSPNELLKKQEVK